MKLPSSGSSCEVEEASRPQEISADKDNCLGWGPEQTKPKVKTIPPLKCSSSSDDSKHVAVWTSSVCCSSPVIVPLTQTVHFTPKTPASF